MACERKYICLIVTGLLVVLGICSVLLGISFSDLHHYQYGFIMQRSSGKVDTSTVYDMGHYLLGPDTTFKIYQADAHFERLNEVAIFTSDKLEVWVTASYQYYLRKGELYLLHDSYDIYYEDILRNNGLDAFKNAATSFSLDEYIQNRATIEEALYKAVRERLGGTCCGLDCLEEETGCAPGCKSRDQCTDNDKGLFASVQFFQMQKVIIPEDVAGRYLKNLVVKLEKEKAEYEQRIAVVNKETQREVETIRQNTAEIREMAGANATLIEAQAEANATATVEQARSQGLKQLYDRLGLDQEDYKNSFDYLRTIQKMSNAHLSVEFDQLIAGPFTN